MDRTLCRNRQIDDPSRVAQKNLVSTLTCDERLALLERGSDALPLTIQAHLLSLNRSHLYYRPVGPDAEEIALKHRTEDIDTDRPFYRSRRMTTQLNHEGYPVNRKRVQRYMREMGIWGLAPGPQTSTRCTPITYGEIDISGHFGWVYPVCRGVETLRNLASTPNTLTATSQA